MQMNTPDIESFLALVKQASRKAQSVGAEVLASYSQPWDAVDPLDLFTAAEDITSDRWYWEHPEHDFAIVSVGIVSGLTPPRNVRFQEVDRATRNYAAQITAGAAPGTRSPGPIFFAAFSYDPMQQQDRLVWQGFPSTYLFTPRLTLVRNGDDYTLTINASVSAGSVPDNLVQSAREFNAELIAALDKQSTNDLIIDELAPDKTNEKELRQFINAISQAESAIRRDELDVVTLCRRKKLTTGGLYRLNKAIKYLRGRFPQSRIVAAGRHGSTFVAYAPGTILRREGSAITATCTTGSERRGDSPELDAALANQLNEAPDEQDHHELAVDHMFESLEPCCEELSAPDEPDLISTSERHHLRTVVSGTLNRGSSLMAALRAVYPPVELSGSPNQKAAALIHEHEEIDRGWFSAPFGWLDRAGDGEFIAATHAALVRSPVMEQQRAYLFTTSDIHSGADPEDLIAQTNLELEPLREALKQ